MIHANDEEGRTATYRAMSDGKTHTFALKSPRLYQKKIPDPFVCSHQESDA